MRATAIRPSTRSLLSVSRRQLYVGNFVLIYLDDFDGQSLSSGSSIYITWIMVSSRRIADGPCLSSDAGVMSWHSPQIFNQASVAS
jgi:hypothetical protein